MGEGDQPSIHERVRNVIIDTLGVNADQVQPGKRLAEDLAADDLDGIELIMDLEHEFSIIVSDEEAESAKTVQDLYDLVDRKCAGN